MCRRRDTGATAEKSWRCSTSGANRYAAPNHAAPSATTNSTGRSAVYIQDNSRMKRPSQFVVLWGIIGATVFSGNVGAQSRSTQLSPGTVVVAKVTGAVSAVVDGAASELKDGEIVSQSAKVNTGPDASVILLFSNGTSVKLGADTEIIVQEFWQAPVSAPNNARAAGAAPSESRTTLALNRGEIVGKVHDLLALQGSSFAVKTPVGVAESAGGIFLISIRTAAAHQVLFQLCAVDREIGFVVSGGSDSHPGKRLVVPPGQEISLAVEIGTK